MSLRTVNLDAGGDAMTLALILCKLGLAELTLTPADAQTLFELRQGMDVVLALGANGLTGEVTLRFIERRDMPGDGDLLQ
jgi:hypothetical protein